MLIVFNKSCFVAECYSSRMRLNKLVSTNKLQIYTVIRHFRYYMVYDFQLHIKNLENRQSTIYKTIGIGGLTVFDHPTIYDFNVYLSYVACT